MAVVIHTASVRRIIKKYHIYADDKQIYFSFDPSQEAATDTIHRLKACIEEIKLKTELILLGSKHMLNKVSDIHIDNGNTTITPVKQVRNLGVFLDASMTLTSHISSIVKSASFQLRNLGKIRKYLDSNTTEQLAHVFVTSRLDIGNAILYGLPNEQTHRLQLIQNTAARLVIHALNYPVT